MSDMNLNFDQPVRLPKSLETLQKENPETTVYSNKEITKQISWFFKLPLSQKQFTSTFEKLESKLGAKGVRKKKILPNTTFSVLLI